MKNRKLLVPVRCTSRKFYLSKIAGRNDWHIRFTDPTHERITRNTGTKEPAAAKRIAADIIESFWNDAGRGAETLKLRSNYATIGELIERYKECAQERPRTLRSNVQSLITLVELGLHRHGGPVLMQSTAELTDDLIRTFERRRIDFASARGSVAVARSRNSTASYLRQARSIVAPRKMKFYKGMKLPDLTLFRAECVASPAQPMPRPLDMNALAAMEAEAPTLAVSDPAVYVAHLLFSRLGLRNIEILNARWDWITEGRIGIIERPEDDFSPKGCEGYVPIAPDVLAELERFRDASGYLVPGSNMTERHAAIYRRHSRWVSRWIKDRTKTSYELRRYAGSRLLDMGATIFEVRDFLRHRDVMTTQRFYLYRLQNRELRTIGMNNLVSAAA